ncbi:hypothetical protein [Yersinia aldovae]|uniref:hypothetical protein n=1 Tax=Yersinia aldovae TaxID=29483 RepID=UPI0011A86DC6|nr:hypothetical protein [Yersinia aldovae]
MKNSDVIAILFLSCFLQGCSVSPKSMSDVSDTDFAQAILNSNNRMLMLAVTSDTVTTNGSASWLTSDLIITASHIWDNMPKDSTITVVSGRQSTEATLVVRDPSHIRDIAVVRVKPNGILKSPLTGRIPVCTKPIIPAQRVIIASGQFRMLSDSYGSPDKTTILNGMKISSALTGYFPKRSSGSPVYEVPSLCLAGLISQQYRLLAMPDIYMTKIVTADVINSFLKDNNL